MSKASKRSQGKLGPLPELQDIIDRDGPNCFYCGKPMTDPSGAIRRGDAHYRTWEHLIAVADGGDNSRRNMRLAGSYCNARVGSLPKSVKIRMRDTWFSPQWPDYPRHFYREGKYVGGVTKLFRVWQDAPNQPLPEESDYLEKAREQRLTQRRLRKYEKYERIRKEEEQRNELEVRQRLLDEIHSSEE